MPSPRKKCKQRKYVSSPMNRKENFNFYSKYTNIVLCVYIYKNIFLKNEMRNKFNQGNAHMF